MGINFNEIKQQTEENSELINYYNNKGANAKIDRNYLYGGVSIKNLVIDWSNA